MPWLPHDVWAIGRPLGDESLYTAPRIAVFGVGGIDDSSSSSSGSSGSSSEEEQEDTANSSANSSSARKRRSEGGESGGGESSAGESRESRSSTRNGRRTSRRSLRASRRAGALVDNPRRAAKFSADDDAADDGGSDDDNDETIERASKRFGEATKTAANGSGAAAARAKQKQERKKKKMMMKEHGADEEEEDEDKDPSGGGSAPLRAVVLVYDDPSVHLALEVWPAVSCHPRLQCRLSFSCILDLVSWIWVEDRVRLARAHTVAMATLLPHPHASCLSCVVVICISSLKAATGLDGRGALALGRVSGGALGEEGDSSGDDIWEGSAPWGGDGDDGAGVGGAGEVPSLRTLLRRLDLGLGVGPQASDETAARATTTSFTWNFGGGATTVAATVMTSDTVDQHPTDQCSVQPRPSKRETGRGGEGVAVSSRYCFWCRVCVRSVLGTTPPPPATTT